MWSDMHVRVRRTHKRCGNVDAIVSNVEMPKRRRRSARIIRKKSGLVCYKLYIQTHHHLIHLRFIAKANSRGGGGRPREFVMSLKAPEMNTRRRRKIFFSNLIGERRRRSPWSVFIIWLNCVQLCCVVCRYRPRFPNAIELFATAVGCWRTISNALYFLLGWVRVAALLWSFYSHTLRRWLYSNSAAHIRLYLILFRSFFSLSSSPDIKHFLLFGSNWEKKKNPTFEQSPDWLIVYLGA